MAIPLTQLPPEHTATEAFVFADVSNAAAGDARLQRSVGAATERQAAARQLALRQLPDADALRTLAGRIKQHTLDHLDYYLEQLKANVEKNGGHVHFARDGAEASRIILDIARREGCRSVIKSKSMVSEEIHLASILQAAGLDVVETDLGEFIIQLRNDRPSHLVAPVIHLGRAEIARLFSDYFKTPLSDDPVALTRQARAFLREKFRRADLGITGGNFLVAETGHLCCVENEGNQRQSLTTPRVLVSLVGIEKVVPRMADLAVMLKLLGRSATGQPMTIYTNLFGGPRAPGETDGPEVFHLILMDNGRSEILAGEYRETLRCIRCAACLNVCPVYRKIGGHAYGSVYPGPIGALLTPLMKGLDLYKDLPQASSLCGACFDACPVKIDIPRHLIAMRRDLVQQRRPGRFERGLYRLWAWALRSPWRYRWLSRLQKWDLRRRASADGWVKNAPGPARGWTQIRDLPAPAPRSFRQMWKDRGQHR
jgi:L-lactate dehydrogenase complex protein LldF